MNVPFPEKFRENIRCKITDILEKVEKETIYTKEELQQASVNIEIGIFNFAIQKCKEEKIIRHWSNQMFVLVYTDRLRTILFNLKHSTFLTEYLFSPTSTSTSTSTTLLFRAQQMVTFTHQQLNPAIWADLLAAKEKRNETKFEKDKKTSTSTLFTCKQCKSTNCSYSQYQTKSGDEAMTIFITCNNCGKNSKIN
jgi:DNA-directed RNA polymerase subunit M/transcription elongation factor TFIIS